MSVKNDIRVMSSFAIFWSKTGFAGSAVTTSVMEIQKTSKTKLCEIKQPNKLL